MLKQQHVCFKYWLERLKCSWNGLVQNEKKVGLVIDGVSDTP